MTDPDVKALARRIHNLEERIAALGRARQLTSSSIPVAVEGEDGPETVDMPLTVGVSQGVQAGAIAGQALEAAEQAAEDALLAKVTADGRNRIYAQPLNPVASPSFPFVNGDLWYRTETVGGLTRFVEVFMWNGTEWKPYQMVASSLLVPGSVGAVLIENGGITGPKIAGDAIDGKTITGAIVRTAASGQRMQFDVNGMRAFNAAGTVVANLKSGSSGFDLLPSGASGPYLRMWPSILEFIEQTTAAKRAHYAATGYWIEPPASAGTSSGCRNVGGPSSVDIYRDYTHSGGFAVSQYASARAYGDSPVIGVQGTTPAGTASAYLEVTYSVGGVPSSAAAADKVWTAEIQRRGGGSVGFKSPVEFLGDTPWTVIPLASGYMPYNDRPPMYKVQGGVLYTKGAVRKVTGTLDNTLQIFSALGSIPNLVGVRDSWDTMRVVTSAAGVSPGRMYIQPDGAMVISAISGVAAYYTISAAFPLDL